VGSAGLLRDRVGEEIGVCGYIHHQGLFNIISRNLRGKENSLEALKEHKTWENLSRAGMTKGTDQP
jgi:hypothetical protein